MPDAFAVRDDFIFEWYEGGVFGGGFRLIRVTSERQLRLVSREWEVQPDHRIPHWKSHDFEVSADMVKELNSKLQERGFSKLKTVYEDPRIADGTQLLIRIVSDGKEKIILCNNKFPKPIESLRKFLDARIFNPFEKEVLEEGAEITIKETYPPFEWPRE